MFWLHKVAIIHLWSIEQAIIQNDIGLNDYVKVQYRVGGHLRDWNCSIGSCSYRHQVEYDTLSALFGDWQTIFVIGLQPINDFDSNWVLETAEAKYRVITRVRISTNIKKPPAVNSQIIKWKNSCGPTIDIPVNRTYIKVKAIFNIKSNITGF